MTRPVSPSPSASTPQIGAKLRATRLAQGLTIEQLATATGLSKGFVSRLERDDTSPSVATLVAVCEALSLPVGSLFEAPTSALVTAQAAPRINMGGSGTVDRLITPRGQGEVQLLRSSLQPGASGGDELYAINCSVEVLHVIAGEVTVRFVNDEHTLHAGDTLTFPGHQPHTWVNGSTEPAEVIWTLSPAPWSGSA